MRVLSLTLVLSTLAVGAGCNRADAASEELTEQSFTDSSEAVPQPSASARIEQAAPPAEPQVVTETNIKRDAAIGAGLGAAVGAITNEHNRTKGALVGGVIGGAAGAIAGATVDKKEKVVDPR
jgi:uncharacterized membrane protein